MEGRSASVRVVLTALAGNLAIAVTKFAAFAVTGSTAMLTEAVHSLVDTGDQGLLLVGEARAARPPDAAHPFGHGLEAYFWSFVVALMIFLAGGAVSVWEGVEKLIHPMPIHRPWVSLVVLLVSAAFEGLSFRTAYRGYRKMVQGRQVRLWRFIRISKDPNLFATLLEDGAALAGLGVAALGTIAAAWLGAPWADGLASVAIGVLLVAVAVVLANETRSLIAGEAAAPPIVDAAREAVVTCPDVASLDWLASLHLGPESILIALAVRLHPGLADESAERARAALVERIRAADPRVGEVLFRPASPRLSATVEKGT